MNTLFRKANGKDNDAKLYGRDNFLAKIEDYIIGGDEPENVALIGLTGVGKSSIIQKAFDESHRIRYYKEKKIITIFVPASRPTSTMKIFYKYLNSAILKGLDELERIDKNAYTALTQQVDKQKKKVTDRSDEMDEVVWESILSKTVETIQRVGYHLLLVIDDFEQFAVYSNLKAAQYSYLRGLANSGELSLFIATCKDLTKVSEEMVGSGFENIFFIEELRGIREDYIDQWVQEIAPDVAANDDAMDWISNVSDGIPELICEAGDLIYDSFDQGEAFDNKKCTQRLCIKAQPLMSRWWQETSRIERFVLRQILEDKSVDSIERDCLIKRGYLNQTDSEKIVFASPIFEEYVFNMLTNDSPIANIEREEESKKNDEGLKLENMILEVGSQVSSVNERMNAVEEAVFDLLDVFELRETLSSLDTGNLDNEKYAEEVRKQIVAKLTIDCSEELCDKWNINQDFWVNLSDNSRKDLSTAYQLYKYIYPEEIDDITYKPVTVCLGNFLEEVLNIYFLPILKKYVPYYDEAKDAYGKKRALCDMSKMTIGNYAFVLEHSDICYDLCKDKCANDVKINSAVLDSFSKKIKDCNEIRIKSDHSGEIINYKSMNKFLCNLFHGKNSIVNVISRIYFTYFSTEK